MKKYRVTSYVLIVALSLFYACNEESEEDKIPDPPQKGMIDTTLTVYSEIMDMQVPFSVYLPYEYEASGIDYPVLYLLHGATCDHHTWMDHGMADIMDECIYNQSSESMVVIMPNSFKSFCTNSCTYSDVVIAYEDFLINEFIPYIETHYRVKSDKQNRAISGDSMGGYSCTYLGFKYQDLFGSCYAMSGVYPSPGYNCPDIRDIVNAKSTEELQNLPAYVIEVGTQDILVYNMNEDFHEYLILKSIDHVFLTRNGTHNWNFWQECLPNALSFISEHFD